VERWCAAVPEEGWKTIEVRAGDKGPLVVRAALTWVQARTEGCVSDVMETLVVFREKQTDGSWKHDYLLSNAWITTTLEEFARVLKAEHRIEECLQRAKGEAGLADYQVRTWVGWHHHQTLALLSTWFLTQETRRGKNTDPCDDGAAGAEDVRAVAQWEVELQWSGANPTQSEPPFETQRRSTILSLAPPQPFAATAVPR
jgi:hypothetical protein